MSTDNTTERFPQPRRNDGGTPCGECHIKPGETCDICGASRDALATRALPCPFCGSPAVTRSGTWAGADNPPKWGIECTGCTVQGGTHDTKAAAIAEWNKRT